jgi:hypothetical protein
MNREAELKRPSRVACSDLLDHTVISQLPLAFVLSFVANNCRCLQALPIAKLTPITPSKPPVSVRPVTQNPIAQRNNMAPIPYTTFDLRFKFSGFMFYPRVA